MTDKDLEARTRRATCPNHQQGFNENCYWCIALDRAVRAERERDEAEWERNRITGLHEEAIDQLREAQARVTELGGQVEGVTGDYVRVASELARLRGALEAHHQAAMEGHFEPGPEDRKLYEALSPSERSSE